MTTLKPPRFIAMCIFSLTEKSEIRAMIKRLRIHAQAGHIPSKKIGARLYYYPEWFLSPDAVKAQGRVALWLR